MAIFVHYKVKLAQVTACLMLLIMSQHYSFADSTNKAAESKLKYQEVFYHFYRKDEFNAIVNLQAGISEERILNKGDSNNLLLGSLYYMYGLTDMAEEILLKTVKASTNSRQKAIGWLYLAKLYYEIEDYRALTLALQNVNNNLPQSMLAERNYLQAMLYINTGELAKARRLVNSGEKDLFSGTILFNLGAAYLKNNKAQDGLTLLRQVGRFDSEEEELLALKDRANIVLGYYYLRNKNSEDAVQVFENVRLTGPFSNKALLGLGWAYSGRDQYRKALIPWLALSEKNATDLTVQEAQLAVPYAFRQLKADETSLQRYKASIAGYEAVKQELELMMNIAKKSSFFSLVLNGDGFDDFTITSQLIAKKNAREIQILAELLNDKEFQSLFDKYRDLKQLEAKVILWKSQLEQMKLRLDIIPEDAVLSSDGEPRRRPFVKNKRHYVETLLTVIDKVKVQETRLEIVTGMFESLIQEEIVKALQVRHQYVLTYLSQTRFAMAQLLDKSLVPVGQ